MNWYMNNLDLVMYPLKDFIQLLVLVLDVVHTVLENDLVYGVTIVKIYCLIEFETLLVDLIHVVAQLAVLNILLVDGFCLVLRGGGTGATRGFGVRVLSNFFINKCIIFCIKNCFIF